MSNNKITKLDTVIRNSLETYDTNQLKFKKFIAKVKYIKFIDNKNATNHIVFYDKNKKQLFDSAFEVMGIFVPQNNMWKWSWSIPTMKNKFTFISRKILEYAFNLDPQTDYMLRSEFINSKFTVINKIQLDIHVAISSYISKTPFIFRWYAHVPDSDYDDEENEDDDEENKSDEEEVEDEEINDILEENSYKKKKSKSKSKSRRKKLSRSRDSEARLEMEDNLLPYDPYHKKNKESMSYFFYIMDYNDSVDL